LRDKVRILSIGIILIGLTVVGRVLDIVHTVVGALLGIS